VRHWWGQRDARVAESVDEELRRWPRGAQLDALVGLQEAALSASVPHGHGHQDATALVRFELFERLGRARPVERAHLALARSAGWWFPLEDVAFLCERPVATSTDGHGRLHGESAPAIAYADGWEIWALHGVRTSRKVVIAPDTLTAAEILAETNQEQQRLMLERFGLDRFMREGGARTIHATPGATLYRFDDASGQAIVTVRVTCPSTGRVYHLRVPPWMRSAPEAVAWTFSMPAESYRPSIET
jgi:hypothetical protein